MAFPVNMLVLYFGHQPSDLSVFQGHYESIFTGLSREQSAPALVQLTTDETTFVSTF